MQPPGRGRAGRSGREVGSHLGCSGLSSAPPPQRPSRPTLTSTRPPCRWLAPGLLAPPQVLSACVHPGPGGTGPGGSSRPKRSVLFICCFNLLSFFTSLFREEAAAASSCRLSVCLCLGQGGSGPRCPEDGAAGARGAGRWVHSGQATVNFKEFLQDIFINFFSWLFLEKGVGEGSRWAGLGFVFGSCSWFFLHTHIYIFKERRGPLLGRGSSSPVGAAARGPSARPGMGTLSAPCLRAG